MWLGFPQPDAVLPTIPFGVMDFCFSLATTYSGASRLPQGTHDLS